MKRRKLTRLLITAALVIVYTAALWVEAAARNTVPRPTCNDLPKAGTVLLEPNGTGNAMTQVVFTTPFCSDGLAAFSTVDNGNTAGEATGAKPWGVTAVNVSIQLDAPSNDEYVVYWRVEKATQ